MKCSVLKIVAQLRREDKMDEVTEAYRGCKIKGLPLEAGGDICFESVLDPAKYPDINQAQLDEVSIVEEAYTHDNTI